MRRKREIGNNQWSSSHYHNQPVSINYRANYVAGWHSIIPCPLFRYIERKKLPVQFVTMSQQYKLHKVFVSSPPIDFIASIHEIQNFQGINAMHPNLFCINLLFIQHLFPTIRLNLKFFFDIISQHFQNQIKSSISIFWIKFALKTFLVSFSKHRSVFNIQWEDIQ